MENKYHNEIEKLETKPKGKGISFGKRNMKGGASMGTTEFIAVIAVIAIAIVGGLYVLGGGHIGSATGASQLTSTQGAYAGVCPSNPASKPTLGFQAAYLDQLNHNTNTSYVATTNLSVAGTPYAFRSVLASSTGLITDQNQSCGTIVNLTFGNSANSLLYSVTTQVKLGANNTNIQFVGLQKEAAVSSILWHNSTGSYVTWSGLGTRSTSFIGVGQHVTGGQTYSVQFDLTPGNGDYGGAGKLFYVTGNSVAISGVAISGPNGGGLLPSAPASYASTYNTFPGSTTWAFLAPPSTVWGVAGKETYTVTITTASSMAANTFLNFGYNDCPNYYINGHLVGTCQNGGKNPNTGVDLGEALTMQGGTGEVVNAIGSNSLPAGPIGLFTTG